MVTEEKSGAGDASADPELSNINIPANFPTPVTT